MSGSPESSPQQLALNSWFRFVRPLPMCAHVLGEPQSDADHGPTRLRQRRSMEVKRHKLEQMNLINIKSADKRQTALTQGI